MWHMETLSKAQEMYAKFTIEDELEKHIRSMCLDYIYWDTEMWEDYRAACIYSSSFSAKTDTSKEIVKKFVEELVDKKMAEVETNRLKRMRTQIDDAEKSGASHGRIRAMKGQLEKEDVGNRS